MTQKQIGKLPPQNIEAEEAVLGAILISKNAIHKVMSILPSDAFYKEGHKIIFETCLALHSKIQPIDLLTVTSELRKNSQLDFVGGSPFISMLTDDISSDSNIEFHATLIIEAYYKRLIIKMSSDMVRRCFDPMEDIHDLNESLQAGVLECTQGLFRKKGKTLKELVSISLTELQEAMKNKSENSMTGIPTGLRDMDSLTGGLQRSDLIIIAARPSMGKSALAVQIAQNSLKIMDAVGIIFSLEMKAQQNTKRMLSSLSMVKYSNMSKGEITENEFIEIQNKAMEIYTDNIIVDDTSSTTVLEMKAKATNLKIEKGRLDFIIADYMQLIKGLAKGNREQEIAGISRGLKEMAKDLDVPVIALAQLTRDCEKRTDKRPLLSDLRESGSIEQDADVVIFLYRPEYYGETQDENGESTFGLCEAHFGKHRNGKCTGIKLWCDLSINKFGDWGTQLKPYGIF